MEAAEVADTRTPGAERTGEDRTDEQHHLTLFLPGGAGTKVVTGAAVLTVLLGLVSFVLGMVVRNVHGTTPALHVIATVTGALSIVIGLYFQMISGTRNERIIIVTGMIAGFVGACLGLAAGGFSG
jgi:hypothetical protein